MRALLYALISAAAAGGLAWLIDADCDAWFIALCAGFFALVIKDVHNHHLETARFLAELGDDMGARNKEQ